MSGRSGLQVSWFESFENQHGRAFGFLGVSLLVTLILGACNRPGLPLFDPAGRSPRITPDPRATLPLPPPLCPNPLQVNTTDDVFDGACSADHCSLHEALQASNNCPGPQTVEVPAGTYEMDDSVVIEDAVTVEGAGMDSSIIVTEYGWRIHAPDVTISGLQFRELNAADGSDRDSAFALWVSEGGQLQLTESWIREGWDDALEHFHDTYYGGGAIVSSGNLVVEDSVIERGLGGIVDVSTGIWDLGESLEVSGTEFRQSGVVTEGTFHISDTWFNAGGLSWWSCGTGPSLIERSTFSGAAITTLNQAPLTLQNTTISGNETVGIRVGIIGTCPGGVGASLDHVTITENNVGIETTGPIEARGSIIGGNLSSDCVLEEGASLSSAGYNLDSDGSCGLLGGTGDLSATDPLLLPLGDHGGPTLTHAPRGDSPAVDAVAEGCPAPETDQRGQGRPAGPGCDVGSVELVGSERDVTGAAGAGPTPSSGELTINFNADSYVIEEGECTTLRWRVTGAQLVTVLGAEVEHTEAEEVCPKEDTGYKLTAENNSDEDQAFLEIEVTEPEEDIPGPEPGPSCTPDPNQNPPCP